MNFTAAMCGSPTKLSNWDVQIFKSTLFSENIYMDPMLTLKKKEFPLSHKNSHLPCSTLFSREAKVKRKAL